MAEISAEQLELKRLEVQEKTMKEQALRENRNIRQQALSYAQQNKKEGENILEVAKDFLSFLNGE